MKDSNIEESQLFRDHRGYYGKGKTLCGPNGEKKPCILFYYVCLISILGHEFYISMACTLLCYFCVCSTGIVSACCFIDIDMHSLEKFEDPSFTSLRS